MQDIKQRCLVLAATSYSMVDENTGRTNAGVSVFYLPVESLSPEDDPGARGRGEMALGVQPSKVSLPYEMKEKIKFAPALYDMTLKMVTRQLKMQIQPVDLEYVSMAELRPVKEQKF